MSKPDDIPSTTVKETTGARVPRPDGLGELEGVLRASAPTSIVMVGAAWMTTAVEYIKCLEADRTVLQSAAQAQSAALPARNGVP